MFRSIMILGAGAAMMAGSPPDQPDHETAAAIADGRMTILKHPKVLSISSIKRASRTYANDYAAEHSDVCKPAGYTVWIGNRKEPIYIQSNHSAADQCRDIKEQ